jgi:(R,R)-butanediol dehydrogenase / meso-butanediol dehydrogenase / diacetyl reductase
MKAVIIHGPGDVRIDEVALPQVGDDDVLIKLAACGICGSDLTYAKLGGVAGPAGPMPLGHEFAGTIEAVGTRVSHYQPGQRVVANPYPQDIGNGGPTGAFADFLLVRGVQADPSLVMPIPDHLSFAQAALAEPLAVSLHGVNRGQVGVGERVVVFGAGPIGLGMVVALKHRGVTDIVVVDYSALRLERALALGARAVINPAEAEVAARLAELHGQHMHFGQPVVGTDVYLDAAGAAAVIPSILAMCQQNARLVITAVYSAPVALDLRQVLAKELNITAAMGYPTEFPEVIALLSQGRLNVEPMISHHCSFADFPAAFQLAHDPTTTAKVMITFDGVAQA